MAKRNSISDSTLSRGYLPEARVFDRMLDEVRGYLAAVVVFDRTNTESILPAEIAGETCALPELVARRLAAGMSSSQTDQVRRASTITPALLHVQ